MRSNSCKTTDPKMVTHRCASCRMVCTRSHLSQAIGQLDVLQADHARKAASAPEPIVQGGPLLPGLLTGLRECQACMQRGAVTDQKHDSMQRGAVTARMHDSMQQGRRLLPSCCRQVAAGNSDSSRSLTQ